MYGYKNFDKAPSAVTPYMLHVQKHRVIVPRKAAEEGRVRQSLAFFCQPDDDTIITCVDGSDTYPPINCRDYLWQKFADTY